MLPVAYPITFGNFNYAPITVVVAVAVVSLAWYLPKHGAKHAFLTNRRGAHDSGSDKVRPRSSKFRHPCTITLMLAVTVVLLPWCLLKHGAMPLHAHAFRANRGGRYDSPSNRVRQPCCICNIVLAGAVVPARNSDLGRHTSTASELL